MNHLYFGDNLNVLKQLHRQQSVEDLLNRMPLNIP